jgi:choline dehydrogenase-like flavoprotein
LHIDLNQDGPDELEADVAIVGAGVAGIVLTQRLLARGLRVILLESGGLDYEAATADLNAGESTGMTYYPLDHARLRMFGGTTAIWGGRCAELDPIDFEHRPWVPHSGWPIGPADIAAYYAEARALFDLPAQLPDAAAYRAAGIALPDFAEHELALRTWAFDDRFDRFSFTRWQHLSRQPGCTIITHATVREVVAARNGGSIASLDVRSLAGERLRIRARDYVLAAGGIENPRLLLASRSVMRNGLGNDYDQVGRYFMEHPHARGGRVVGGVPYRLLGMFAKRIVDGTVTAPLLAPSPDLQRREGLLNTSLTIAGRRPAAGRESWGMRAYLHAKHHTVPDRRGRTLWKGTKRTVDWLLRRIDPARPWLLNRLGRLDVALVVRAEQAPNPDSRVRLARDTDALGVPRVALDWQTLPIDVHSVAGLVGALGREAERLGLGRVEPAAWLAESDGRWATDPLISAHPIGGYHHMGTTRMADDPRHGVTDAAGRVHGLANLHIAGSSLFPTSGWANPTLTIAALALRTADAILRNQWIGQNARISGTPARTTRIESGAPSRA